MKHLKRLFVICSTSILQDAASFTIPRAARPTLLPNNINLLTKKSGSSKPLNMIPVDIIDGPTIEASVNTLINNVPSTVLSISPLDISSAEAEAIAGPFFGLSLLPYLAFLYFLNVPENDTPKGVTVGFAACLVFVFLTIPAAIAAQVLYGVSLADSDWLHGSAESLLTMTNLVTVVAFRQALAAKEAGISGGNGNSVATTIAMPLSATSYAPMFKLGAGLTALAGVTAIVPAIMAPEVHTPYLNGFMDLPKNWVTFGHADPENSLTVAT